MKNYFEILGVEEKISFDSKVLRKQFFKLSLQNHPDKNLDDKSAYISASETTNAYETLGDKYKRIGYILTLNKITTPDSKDQPSMDFLMEMMDINDSLMSLESHFNQASYIKLKDTVSSINLNINEVILGLENKLISTFEKADFEKLKNYYYKKRYLLRIFKKLDKFATL